MDPLDVISYFVCGSCALLTLTLGVLLLQSGSGHQKHIRLLASLQLFNVLTQGTCIFATATDLYQERIVVWMALTESVNVLGMVFFTVHILQHFQGYYEITGRSLTVLLIAMHIFFFLCMIPIVMFLFISGYPALFVALANLGLLLWNVAGFGLQIGMSAYLIKIIFFSLKKSKDVAFPVKKAGAFIVFLILWDVSLILFFWLTHQRESEILRWGMFVRKICTAMCGFHVAGIVLLFKLLRLIASSGIKRQTIIKREIQTTLH
jgi:hypothetical protein